LAHSVELTATLPLIPSSHRWANLS